MPYFGFLGNSFASSLSNVTRVAKSPKGNGIRWITRLGFHMGAIRWDFFVFCLFFGEGFRFGWMGWARVLANTQLEGK